MQMVYAHPKHGHLLRYWYEGNNFDFVYLLDRIRHVELCQEIIDLEDQNEASAVEEARKYLLPADDYFQSFAQLAVKLWEAIKEPYSTIAEKDLGDFINEGEVEEEEEENAEASHRALDSQAARQSMDSEHQMLEHLQTRYGRTEDYIESEEESEELELVDLEDDLEDHEEVVNPYDDVKNGGYFESSSSEEEDEWEKQIMSKRNSLGSRNSLTPRKSPKRSVKSPNSASSRKRRGKLKQEQSSSDDEVFETVVKTAGRLRAIEDDSDDGE
jgi:hypothetical protein